jgi:hypothetical protein
MECQLCTLDICGLDVEVILTDDKKLLGSRRGKPSFGRYSVDQGAIWLDANLTPSVLRSHLFHEVYEFVLGYFNVIYHPGREHESFMRFSNVLWCVFKANQEILFGDKLVMLAAQS